MDSNLQFLTGNEDTVFLQLLHKLLQCELGIVGILWGCASYFGLSTSKAQTTGLFGTVIGPDAWLPYLVRHELIHQLQNERMGTFRHHPSPEWFLEGMAYSLSDDPRSDLGASWQADRARFDTWYTGPKKANLWAEAARLR